MGTFAVLGIGNTYVSDDGVGVFVVREIRKQIRDTRVLCAEVTSAGLEVLDYLQGCEKALIIDAVTTGTMLPGQVTVYSDNVVPRTAAPQTMHFPDFRSVVELGPSLGLQMPDSVTIFAVEVEDADTFHEGCTPLVNAAIPGIVLRVIKHLQAAIPDLRFSQVEREVYDDGE